MDFFVLLKSLCLVVIVRCDSFLNSIQIVRANVTASIIDGYAQTVVTETFYNPTDAEEEISFQVFPPENAFITEITMYV